ncbi:hypothetical protein [Nonomuraea sp. 10N515B]|uniref:hypothetical protein n=1 Tax=Nonomuraea sp. 10N515B TaxID=3457422 RepID=UPI003FCE9FE6
MFFPYLAQLAVEEVTDHGDYVLVTAYTGGGPAACPVRTFAEPVPGLTQGPR